MNNSPVRVTEQDGLLTVTLTRPAKLNAINPEMTEILWSAARALGDRDDLRCMLIAAEGRFFSAGVDLREGAGTRQGDPATRHQHPGWALRRNARDHHLLYDEFEALEKPIVLAAHAHCFGGAMEMAMSCDFRFCTPEAEWKLPEIELGVIAGSGGSSRLTRLMGPGWAKYMAMAGMGVRGEQAKAIGLVHDVFPAESFHAEVQAFCRRLISLPAEALGLAKLSVDLSEDVSDRNAQRHIDRIINASLSGSPDNLRLTERFRT
ncbi:MAG: enoyl-CoA hydratase/isomerase family protein [Amphiplicatus sp.]